ncbi:NADH-quinone oxidoreductase subunit L [Rubellicoccus peritrichatus]|uniref:NADH-quinone oxidoreductase subunit L n=1 Tax=Rubellicoccus peritrichatus TaxID=3080537 RepID=A0AAQ3L5X5_9BACT|nr:NADH-quinone oxidoreductase subunit L [Puniceicoccus sp. CR14]WOO39486.1 NADH-quinone oxidoreductase subunit L [Puniceicoccus sp. CR14]
MEPSQILTTILLAPLVSAAIICLFLRRGGYAAAAVSVVAAGVIMVLSLYWLLIWDGVTVHYSTTWLQFGSFHIDIGYLFNYEAATMLFIVAFVGFWIHFFSVGYMDDDKNKGRFFGGLSIFMFSMLGIVLADNLFMIFIFWELVGFSSYMLIAHYWDKGFAADASKKAFIVNRIGDFGFLIGIVWAYHYYGTADLSTITKMIQSGSADALTGIGLLLMCGFVGKSAQFPLQVWLTDAMAGPTPVSALIHAATMVAAGIFFMVRIFFMLTPFALEWILWSGAIMTTFAGFCALGQTDIKKSLAYSTLAHLGYMATAIGLGFPGLAIMHMAMHACFKATLFLCSGSVIHACHHEQDMFKMGGLFKKMPITGIAFFVATLSISAVPFTAGYYSKDTIIASSWGLYAQGLGDQYLWAFILTMVGALLTALYMGRMFFVVFLGKPNSEKAEHAKESSFWMFVPLIVLGWCLSLGAGWFVYDMNWANGEMNAMLPSDTATFMVDGYDKLSDDHNLVGGGWAAAHHVYEEAHAPWVEWISYACILGGFVFTFFFYGLGASEDRLQKKFPSIYKVFERHGWFDDLYDWYVAKVQQRFADFIGFLDLILISGLAVRGTAGVTGLVGLVCRSLHVGSLHAYVYWFLLGVIIFGAFALGLL